MVDQRRDVLEQDVQLGDDGLRGLLTLKQGGNHALLIHDVLANDHRVLLQLVDVQQEFVAHIFTQADALAVLCNLLGHQLDHVGIEVDSGLEDAQQDMESGREEFAVDLDAALDVRKTAQGYLADGGEDRPGQDKGDRLHRVVVRGRNQEVRVDEDGAGVLRITGGTLDLLGLCAALQVGVQKLLDIALFITSRIEKVEPKGILDCNFLEYVGGLSC